jgi:hypothetical protein
MEVSGHSADSSLYKRCVVATKGNEIHGLSLREILKYGPR